MRTIDNFFAHEAPSTLYHYSGIGALLGIVAGRKVWASHIYYMNDSAEISHAYTILLTVLTDTLSTINKNAYRRSDSNEEYDFTAQFLQWLETIRRTPYHLFVFSLSEKRSLLSQWRSYTPHGKGVSIGFSQSTLNAMLKSSQSRIAKCLYAPDDQRELANGLVNKMTETFRQRLPHFDTSRQPHGQEYYSLLEEFREDILQVLSLIKHPAFEEEREWRVISPYFPKYTVPEIKFREGSSMLMPYIEVDLPSEGLLFDEVILGPTEHAHISHPALSTFLSNKAVCNITSNSNIPYREW